MPDPIILDLYSLFATETAAHRIEAKNWIESFVDAESNLTSVCQRICCKLATFCIFLWDV